MTTPFIQETTMTTPIALRTPTDLETNAVRSVADALNAVLADS